jgi:hypothetical protein
MTLMKSNLAIVSVTLAFAVSSFAAPAPGGAKHHALAPWEAWSLFPTCYSPTTNSAGLPLPSRFILEY